MNAPRKLFALGCGLQIVLYLLLFSFAMFIVVKCDNYMKKHDTTIIKEIGKGVRNISDEFNEGYNATDTTSIDSTEIK